MATCKDCLHYEACVDMLNAVRLVVDGAGHLVDKRCRIFEQKEQWIPVTERLPVERDSIFARFYDTKHWLPGMFRTVSDTALASIEKEDGARIVRAMHTQGGEWNLDSMPWAKKVTHWMPFPEPPKEDE